MVEIRNLTAGYGGKPVLKDVSLTFPMGQVTAILGPNGCGKSTLLKAIVGLVPPTAGELRTEQPLAQNVAYLPQTRRLPEMTAGRLVLHGRFPWLGYPRRYRAEDHAAAKQAMDRLGIGGFADTPLAELSGGTRQKAYIAMALAQNAPTILLDEPTSFLDIGHQLRFLELCRELAAEGRAVVIVLHDLPQALRYADRVVVMKDGEVLTVGAPSKVMSTGILDMVFGVHVLRVGTHYVCEKPDPGGKEH